MHVRFKFKDLTALQKVAEKLPIGCKWNLVTDRTTDVYLEVPEQYEDYIERYLLKRSL